MWQIHQDCGAELVMTTLAKPPEPILNNNPCNTLFIKFMNHRMVPVKNRELSDCNRKSCINF
jgi:hypothetical protein